MMLYLPALPNYGYTVLFSVIPCLYWIGSALETSEALTEYMNTEQDISPVSRAYHRQHTANALLHLQVCKGVCGSESSSSPPPPPTHTHTNNTHASCVSWALNSHGGAVSLQLGPISASLESSTSTPNPNAPMRWVVAASPTLVASLLVRTSTDFFLNDVSIAWVLSLRGTGIGLQVVVHRTMLQAWMKPLLSTSLAFLGEVRSPRRIRPLPCQV